MRGIFVLDGLNVDCDIVQIELDVSGMNGAIGVVDLL